MTRTRRWFRLAAISALGLVPVAACGSDGTVREATTTSTRSTTTTTTGTEPDLSTPDTIAHEPARAKDAEYHGGVIAGIDLSGLDLPEGRYASAWREVVDETDTLAVSVASGWDEDDPLVGEVEGVEVPSIFTSPGLDRFQGGYEVPGLKLLLYGQDAIGGDRADLLRRRREGAGVADVCDRREEFDYDDGLYQGVAELWTGCTGSGAAYLIVVASPDVADAAFELVLEVQMLTLGDVDVAVEAIQTFVFTGSAEDVPGTTEPPTPTTPATTAPPADDSAAYRAAIAKVTAHLGSCGMSWDWTSAQEQGTGLWSVNVWIIPPGPAGDNGDPGEGEYLVDLDTGDITSTNGTANVLCPG